MKIALTHDWLLQEGGAEKVLREIHALFPAPIYTLFAKGALQDYKIHTSYLQPLKKVYRWTLPFFFDAVSRFDLSSYDCLISSSHAAAKNITKRKGQLHICYCHTPMRYIWDLASFYWKGLPRFYLQKLREADLKSSQSVDHFIANSQTVAERIKRIYGREATVIYPPVDTERFRLGPVRDDYYLTYSRLVPYKRVDLIMETFRRFPDKKLVVMGEGPEGKKLRARAPANVTFIGFQEAPEKTLARAKALLFAAEEDFGIIPVEALLCGTPVIAFGKGGVTESVEEHVTGLFFEKQEVESLAGAIKEFEENQRLFDPVAIRKSALKFSKERFAKEFRGYCENLGVSRGEGGAPLAFDSGKPFKTAP